MRKWVQGVKVLSRPRPLIWSVPCITSLRSWQWDQRQQEESQRVLYLPISWAPIHSVWTSVRPYLSTAGRELTLVISREAKGQHIWRVNRKWKGQNFQVGTICHSSRLSRKISVKEEFQKPFEQAWIRWNIKNVTIPCVLHNPAVPIFPFCIMLGNV